MLSYLANLFSSPLVHVPFMFAALHLLAWLRFHPKFCKLLSILPLVWLYVCSLTYPSALLIKQLEDDYKVIKLESNEWHETDAIVVLACYYFEDEGLPFVSHWPNCSMQRNLHASLMYERKPLPIYLAGGILGTKAKTSIANYNKSFFKKAGIANDDIHTISEGRNTATEALALAPKLKGKYISLVTSASHMKRAVSYFESHGIKVLPIPVDHLSNTELEPMLGPPNARSLYRSERAIHEYLGLIYQEFIQ